MAGMVEGTLLLRSQTVFNVKEGLQDFWGPPDRAMVTVLLKRAFPDFPEPGKAGIMPQTTQIAGLYARTSFPLFEFIITSLGGLAGAPKACRKSRVPEACRGVPEGSEKSGTPGWGRATPKEGVVQI